MLSTGSWERSTGFAAMLFSIINALSGSRAPSRIAYQHIKLVIRESLQSTLAASKAPHSDHVEIIQQETIVILIILKASFLCVLLYCTVVALSRLINISHRHYENESEAIRTPGLSE